MFVVEVQLLVFPLFGFAHGSETRVSCMYCSALTLSGECMYEHKPLYVLPCSHPLGEGCFLFALHPLSLWFRCFLWVNAFLLICAYGCYGVNE